MTLIHSIITKIYIAPFQG